MTLRADELLAERSTSLDASRFLLRRDGGAVAGTGGGGEGFGFATYAGAITPHNVADVWCRWQYSAVQITEGTFAAASRVLNVQLNRTAPVTLVAIARVTGGTVATSDYELRDAAGNASTSEVTVIFPPGAISAPIVVWIKSDASVEGTETLELTLETDGTIVYNGEQSPYRVSTNATFGHEVLTINAIDATAPSPPEWSWTVGSTVVVPETIGTFPLEIGLDGPAINAIQIRVTSANGSPAALAGTHYVAVDTIVNIPAGGQVGSLNVTILDDPAGVVGPNLEFELTGAVISGTCNDPTADTLVVEIEDDDLSSSTREVQWSSATVGPLVRPETVAEQLSVALVATVDIPFTISQDIPVTITNTNAALGLDYAITWQPNVPAGFIRFTPQQPTAIIRFTPQANGPNAGLTSVVELTLGDGSTWDLGANDTLTITIQAASSGQEEQTRLFVKRGIRNGRTLVEGLVAVVPPSSTLPRFNIDGEDCQVIGHARDSSGNWDSAWVVGIADNDISASAAAASLPDGASPIVLEAGAGSTPAENASYDAQSFASMKFRLRPSNTGVTFERTLADNLAGLTTGSEPAQWEGPSGALFPQVGADLRRTFYYRLWLKDPGSAVADDASPPADERCCLVELWMTYRADVDAIVCEGLLKNCAVDKTANQRAANPAADGPVNFRWFDLTDIPAGWAVEWGAQNSIESFSGSTLTIVPSRAQDYYLAPSACVPFRFVLYKSATTTSGEAERCGRDQSTFVAVGHYGPTRQRIYGETGEYMIDHGRAGFPNLGGGWAGVLAAGDTRFARYASGWASGSETWPVMWQRYGWMQTALPRESGEASGDGVNGAGDVLASSSAAAATRLTLMLDICRTRLDAQDVLSGDHDWQYVRVEEYGTGYAPWVSDGFDRRGMFRHPWLNTTQVNGDAIYGAPTATWCLAPTALPWNTTEAAADPGLAFVDHELSSSYQQYAITHMSRHITQIRDGWWLCRSPLAYRQAMQVAAWVSRVVSVYDVDPTFNFAGASYPLKRMNLGHMRANLNTSLQNYGGWRFGSEWWAPGGTVRSWAWCANAMAIAAAIGSDRVRAWLMPVTGIKHWFREWTYMLTFATSEFGLFGTVSTNPNPDAYDVGLWGPTNGTARNGALPHPANPPASSDPFTGQHWAYELSFHHYYLTISTWAVRHRGLTQWPQDRDLLTKQLRICQYQRQAALAHTAQQRDWAFPLFPAVSRGSAPVGGSASSGWDRPPSLNEMLTGVLWWRFLDAGNTQIGKVGTSVYAYRASGDEADLDTFLVSRGMSGTDLASAFATIYGSSSPVPGTWVYGVAGDTGNTQRAYGEHSFWTAWLAEVLNLTS